MFCAAKRRALSARLTLGVAVSMTFACGNLALAADAANGKILVEKNCADCHRIKDWDGETTAALELLIADVAAGKIKHPHRKLELTPQQVADIAAYWTSHRKKVRQ